MHYEVHALVCMFHSLRQQILPNPVIYHSHCEKKTTHKGAKSKSYVFIDQLAVLTIHLLMLRLGHIITSSSSCYILDSLGVSGLATDTLL